RALHGMDGAAPVVAALRRHARQERRGVDRLDARRPGAAARPHDRRLHRVPATALDEHPARLRRQLDDAVHVLGRKQSWRLRHQAGAARLGDHPPMRFGTFYFFQAVPWLSHEEVVHRELEQMEWTEELGFDQIWLTEHHFIDYGLAVDPGTLAAVAASRTRRVRIGLAAAIRPSITRCAWPSRPRSWTSSRAAGS